MANHVMMAEDKGQYYVTEANSEYGNLILALSLVESVTAYRGRAVLG
jgi:hypothetical protein